MKDIADNYSTMTPARLRHHKEPEIVMIDLYTFHMKHKAGRTAVDFLVAELPKFTQVNQ